MFKKIQIYGTIQGVGFRPFIYRMAAKHGLRGYVLNSGNGVEILAEGGGRNIDDFLREIKTGYPPLASIDRILVEDTCKESFIDFTIRKSEKKLSNQCSTIPPDISICRECLDEMSDANNRHYGYPFTVCTNCGPRYTTVRNLPYDRENTTMVEFPLCEACAADYVSPADRRYHAQPICCSRCGPATMLYDSSANLIIESRKDGAIARAAELLDEGHILAIKGIGGTHLAINARNDRAAALLRKRLGRESQPFAVMARDESAARKFAIINSAGEEVLTGSRRPILVLEKSAAYDLSALVSPGLYNIGVMLPYSGLHHLLFKYLAVDTIVLTSANLPGRPMVIRNEEAFEKLSGIADYYLLHNREIANRTDDSVLMVSGKSMHFIRRSRGYVPQPVKLPFEINNDAVGVGAERDATVCMVHGGRGYLSQYIGNTRYLETLQYHHEVIGHLRGLTGISQKIYGCDLHPLFNTTRYALEQETAIKVQHHHAHLVSLMIDNGLPLDFRIIGIAADGVGFGTDGTIWGGEIMDTGYCDFVRVAGLKTQPMPGGDRAAYYPARMALGILSEVLGDDELAGIPLHFRHQGEGEIVIEQLRKHINVVPTTSAGRVLDAVSALLGLSYFRSYEGEPAMKLESGARHGRASADIPVKFITENGRKVLDTTQILLAVYENLGLCSTADLAFSAEHAVAEGLARLAADAAKARGIGTIGFSGGVSYNRHISQVIQNTVEESGFKFIGHREVPGGDGGISLGQAVVAGLQHGGG